MASKVSVVTGGNKGIGYGICRGLARQVGGTVILTARSEKRGLAAVVKLKEEGCECVYEQLDITDTYSIVRFKERVTNYYGGIDILCNNAGIAYKCASTAPLMEKATVTMETNLVGTRDVTNSLLPLMKVGGRVCHVSSMCGILDRMWPDKRHPIRLSLLSEKLTEEAIMKIMRDYYTAVDCNDYKYFKKDSAYSLSKVLLTALTRVQAKLIKSDPRNILINCCCPGYVDTDMSSHKGPLTIDEGAATPLMVCQLVQGCNISGEFFREMKHFNWEGDCYYHKQHIRNNDPSEHFDDYQKLLGAGYHVITN